MQQNILQKKFRKEENKKTTQLLLLLSNVLCLKHNKQLACMYIYISHAALDIAIAKKTNDQP